MAKINHFEGDNLGGLAKVEITYYTAGLWANLWLDIPITPQSGELRRKTKDSPNGPIYVYSGTFEIHRMREEVEENVVGFLGRCSKLRLTDHNGVMYILGNIDNPVLLEEESTTGKQIRNKNGYIFSFSLTLTKPLSFMLFTQ